ncbi:hypothetical protein BV20DRAFT_524721 [Pilatotrama ljubarskyi]|nr:hypothetical protein BV20DRAFT_524721 [Pilatotrama ljubarskyi]
MRVSATRITALGVLPATGTFPNMVAHDAALKFERNNSDASADAPWRAHAMLWIFGPFSGKPELSQSGRRGWSE